MQSSYRAFNCNWEVGSIYLDQHSLSKRDSYNNLVQLFDARKPLTPLAHVDVGGGAWRVKWHPLIPPETGSVGGLNARWFQNSHLRLTFFKCWSPTYSGGRLVRRFDEHTSLAYGVDWSFALSADYDTIIGSCSFYDHTLHVWQG